MKKLLFATAIAASAAAFATLPTAVDFEGANDYQPNESGSHFFFDGESNSSVVSNDANAASTTKRTANFAEANNANFLALDTEGGTLWRSINDIKTDGGYSLGDAENVAADGTYLDTLVQFTVTEDEAPTVGEGDKLAIWLQAGEGTTNLMVKAALINDLGTITETNFTLNATVNPNEWYRLTIKALADITDNEGLPGFQIYLDGTLLTSSTPTLTSEYLDILGPDDVDDSHYADLVAGKYFASLSSATTLQGVGFQGTGAVDEIVWTEEDPFPAQTIDFTLTWTASEVSAVSYVLSTDLTTTNSLTSGTAVQLTPGDGTATIELIPTFTTGYEFDKVTMGETDLGLTFAIPGVTTNATLFAKAAAPAYPNYIDTTDTIIKGKYDDWKAGVGCDDATASQYLNQFLLNVDESATVGNTALEITKIKQNATAGWDITIGCSLDGVDLTGTVGSTIVCNGYLAVSYTDSLTGTWTTKNIAVTAVDATTGTVTVNVNKANAKFMKVTLTAAPQAE